MTAQRCPAAAVGSAVETAIKAEDTSLLVERHFDESNAAYPRVVIGAISWTGDDTKTTRGWRVDVAISVYSQAKEPTEASGIVDDILAATTESLTIAGDWTFIMAESSGSLETPWSNEIGTGHKAEIRLSIWVEDAQAEET